MTDTPSSAGDPAAEAIKSIRETAKWVVAALAGIATAIAAGSQLSSIGGLELGWRLGLAIVASVGGLLVIGAGIWFTIDMLLPTQIGLAELADNCNAANRAVRDYITSHPELLQGQAQDVAGLKTKYEGAGIDRDQKYAQAQPDVVLAQESRQDIDNVRPGAASFSG